MKVDWKHLIAPAVAIVIVALCVSAYVAEHIDRIRAESVVNAKQQIIAERDKATAELVQQLKDAAAKVTKPEQVPAALPQVITLPAPVVQVPPYFAKSEGNSAKSEGNIPLPDAASVKTLALPGDLIIPKVDVVPLYQQLNTCKQNEAELTTCRQDLADVKVQRDAAITAVKGGTFFTRLKRNAKWFAIGAGVGAGAIAASRR